MRLIDANALHKKISAWPETVMYKDWVQSAIANAPTVYPPPNAPLTLEELREMDMFDWLWIEVVCPSQRQVFYNIKSAYYQVFEDYTYGDALFCGWPGLIHKFEYEDYGKTWLAYRRKPEEETV